MTIDKASLVVRCLILGCALTLMPLGLTSSAAKPPQARHWEDESHQLVVTIESRPTGAAIYGVAGDNLGRQIGTTPLTIRFLDGYKVSGVESAIHCDGCGNIDQVLEISEQKGYFVFGTDRSYVAFKCVVLKEGFEPYLIHDAILDWSAKHVDPFDNPSVHAAFDRVRKHYTAVLQSTTPQPPPVPQQQQQQQQTVIMGNAPGSSLIGTINLTSSVADAEVYVDGAFVGNAPATLRLQEGMHVIEVKASGYTAYRKDVRVLGNSELSLRAELQR